MKRLTLFIILGLLLVGTFAVAADLGGTGEVIEKIKENIKENIIVDSTTKNDLASINITKYDRSAMKCDDLKCYYMIKSEKFNTPIEVERYKIVETTTTELEEYTDYITEEVPYSYEVDKYDVVGNIIGKETIQSTRRVSKPVTSTREISVVEISKVLKSDAEINAEIALKEKERLSEIANRLTESKNIDVIKDKVDVTIK